MNKTELRKTFLAQQKMLAPAERAAKSEQVIKLLFENFDFSQKRFAHCFVTLEKNNELDTFEIFQRFWRAYPALTVCAPRVNYAMNVLETVVAAPETKYVQNKWGILEPEGGEFIAPEKLDAVLIPLIAFDERGFRCGYGKGFYDKFLRKCRADCEKIGLSLFPPVKKIEDVQDFDVPLDSCVAPEKVWRFSSKS